MNFFLILADVINYQVRFKDKTWSSELANPESQLYKEMEEEIQQMVILLTEPRVHLEGTSVHVVC